MKKIFLSLSLVCLFSLCGCSLGDAVMSETTQYLVSAIGFDCKNSEIITNIEAVVVNSEEPEEEIHALLFEGKGKTLKKSVENALSKAQKPLSLSHCALLILGENMNPQKLSEVCDFVFDTEQITVSVAFVESENAEKLLSLEPVSSVTVGYDIVSLLETQSKRKNIGFRNRYFEIEQRRCENKAQKKLPFIKISGKKYSL